VSLAGQELAGQYMKEEPRCLKQVVECLHQKTAKRLSISSLKRLAKKARLRWKRVRKSLKSLRDPEEFTQCQRELEALQKQEDQGKIDLYYFDESGFTLDPYIPYAWQEPGTVIEIPATKGTRINIVGLMNRKNDLHPYMFEQSINTSVIVACLNDFCQKIKKKTMVVMDNSSIQGTGSVSCNSVFLLHLCRFLNQEDLMEREAMVQNPSSHGRDLTGRKVHADEIMHHPVHI